MNLAGLSSEVPRVLVIEDNPEDRELLQRQLRQTRLAEGVHFIDDGKEALRFITKNSEVLDENLMVIFLDLKLPGLGGLELLRKIRKIPGMATIPVIVMTSSQRPSDIEECRKLKVANYVEKPVTFTSFSKAMADVFHLKKSVNVGVGEKPDIGTLSAARF
jgi:CheY-like chemotaxis protein